MNEPSDQQQHQMQFVQTHSNGADELYCPTCGRRLLIQWGPKYQKVVLDTGDEYAIHSGGIGGVAMGAPKINQSSGLSKHEEKRLSDWEKWLGEMNFGSM